MSGAHERARVFAVLEAQALERPPAQRWPWLEAMHVYGQASSALHWRAHRHMLACAWALRDAREVLGQLLRLALVPPGHLLRRLPRGNTGRARISAWAPMPPSAALQQLIEAARQAAPPR